MTDMMTPPEPEMPMEETALAEPTAEPLAAPEPSPDIPPAPPSPESGPVPLGKDSPDGEEKKVGEIQKIADDYVIPISSEGIVHWQKIDKPEEFKKYAEQVSSGLFPTFAPQIMAGLPTKVLLDPYVQMAQQILGPVMNEPNWNDPKWSAALQGAVDPKTGRPVPMTLDQWRQHLMTDPGHGYDRTPEAHSRANDFVTELHKQFGGQQTGGS